jgi:hypothetical protein
VRLLCQERITRKTLVGQHIGGDKQIVLADGMRTKGSAAGELGEVQAIVRLEPGAPAINEGEKANGSLADLGGSRSDFIEGGLGCGVQDAVLPEQFQAEVLVERDGGFITLDQDDCNRLILSIVLPDAENGPGVTEIPLELLPRLCPCRVWHPFDSRSLSFA